MRLTEAESTRRLVDHDHGVLCTMHPERGVDAVPVVYVAGEDGFVGVPIDRVKPKASTRLQRERNLEHDPRSTLLVEHWDRDDWSQLWWVRAELAWQADPSAARTAGLAEQLAASFRQYADEPFSHILVLRVTRVSGWAASGG